MKKALLVLTAFLALATSITAQTLNVKVGNVTYQFPASQTGDMPFASGTSLTIMGKTFATADISGISIDNSEVTNNLVSVTYDGTTASVSVAGNVAQYVSATVSGAHVTIAQSNTDAVDGDEITYQLSGTTTNGSLSLSGSYKCTVSLAGLTMTNPSGAAISITNKKRIQISAKKGTENTLTDCANGEQKGCIYSKGQIQLQGNGTLNVYGKTAHAIKSGDYISIKNLTLNVLSAVKDGINCNKYFQMKSGKVTISAVGDDGIQTDFEEDDTATGETTDHEDENSANVYIEGGSLTITASATAAKGVKATGSLYISGGTINVTTTGGGMWDADESDTKAACGLSADYDMTISGGTLTLKSTGAGGKCMKCDSTMTISGEAVISAITTGSKYTYGSYSSSPKAIKAGTRIASGNTSGNTGSNWGRPGGGGPGGGGNQTSYTYRGGMVITGGSIYAKASNHEAIESKSTIDISGGYIYAESTDDAINSGSTFTISGGYVMGNSSGNDGLDANGNFYIKGGTVVAVSARSPEVALDANTEGGYQLYLQGGTVVAIGGLENGSTITGTAYRASSYSRGTWYGLYSGSTTLLVFKVPSNNSMGTPMVVYSSQGTPTLYSSVTTNGTQFWNGYGNSSATYSTNNKVTLSSYSSGGGGWGGGGWW